MNNLHLCWLIYLEISVTASLFNCATSLLSIKSLLGSTEVLGVISENDDKSKRSNTA